MTHEIPFTLPRGYIDSNGVLHREGTMRLATVADELFAQRDPRVQDNSQYVTVIVLSRVVIRLGTLDRVDPKLIESLYIIDFRYLEKLYHDHNSTSD